MKPLLLHYYITNRCNAKCSFCSIWQEQPKKDAIPEHVLQNLKHAKQAGCSFVDFTGGEPLLHPDLPQFLHWAKRLGFITSVTTNGLLLKERSADLAGLIDLPHISIDADNAQLHDRIHGCTSFEKALASIESALKNRIYPDILFTYTPENINALDGIYQIARKNRLILILDPVFNTRGTDRISSAVHQKALDFSHQKGVYLNKAHLQLRKEGGNHIRSPLCKAVTSTVVILPDNKLALPCYHHRCNNITIDGKLLKVLESQPRKEALQKEGTYSFCEGCHINCYFDPTFQYRINRYFWLSTASKLNYSLYKYLYYFRPLVLPRFLKDKSL